MAAFNARIIDTPAVGMRNLELAGEQGEVARVNARQFLTPHIESGIVSDGVANEIAAAEQVAASSKFVQERNAGKHNDHRSSIARGVTALLSGHGLNAVESQFIGRDAGLFDPAIEMVGEVEQEEPYRLTKFYRMKLPSGIYHAEPNPTSIMFFMDGELSDGLLARADGRFIVPVPGILRVVGGGGELWQNPDYNLDGTHATPPVVDLDLSSIRS